MFLTSHLTFSSSKHKRFGAICLTNDIFIYIWAPPCDILIRWKLTCSISHWFFINVDVWNQSTMLLWLCDHISYVHIYNSTWFFHNLHQSWSQHASQQCYANHAQHAAWKSYTFGLKNIIGESKMQSGSWSHLQLRFIIHVGAYLRARMSLKHCWHHLSNTWDCVLSVWLLPCPLKYTVSLEESTASIDLSKFKLDLSV